MKHINPDRELKKQLIKVLELLFLVAACFLLVIYVPQFKQPFLFLWFVVKFLWKLLYENDWLKGFVALLLIKLITQIKKRHR